MTTTRTDLSPTDIDRAASDERWLGFGYLGERSHLLASTDPECPADPALVATIDQRIIDHANAQRWTYDQLFDWCNSKNGRWLADAAFSGTDWDRIVGWGLLALPLA